MKYRILVFSLLVIVIAMAAEKILAQEKEKFTVLPEKFAERISKQCSRPGLPEFEATWTPTILDIRKMEMKFSHLSRLKSTKCCINGIHIRNPNEYYRQYIGIIVKGKKLIYINAFCADTPPNYWQNSPVLTCDGGCDWGVFYNPQKVKFFDLHINGI